MSRTPFLKKDLARGLLTPLHTWDINPFATISWKGSNRQRDSEASRASRVLGSPLLTAGGGVLSIRLGSVPVSPLYKRFLPVNRR